MADDLAYDDVGSGAPIVFLHGITCERSNWEPVVDVLRDRYRCINVDLAGHGESPRTGNYDVFSQAESVGGFIAALDLDTPVLVGHSYGAFIATLCGTTEPVRGVVNVDQEMDTAAFMATVAPFESRLRGDDFPAAFDEFTATLRPDLVPVERRSLIRMKPDQDVVLSVWATVFDSDPADLVAMVEPALAGFPVPYLAIFGTTISDEERRLIELVPDVEIEEWAGMGHFVQLADPVRTAERIDRFARRL